MVPLASLWLPILLSAVIVFVASFLLHMLLTYHAKDFSKLPNEQAVLDVLRSVPPGDYVAPHATPEMRKDPAFQQRLAHEPMLVLTIMGDKMPKAFQKALIGWFVYGLVVSVFAAYVTGRTHGPGTEYTPIFRIAGTVAFVGYALALAQQSIWWGKKWSATIRSMIDGLIYGLLTAGVFGWLWPR